MESSEQLCDLVLDDIDIIKEIFKLCPEYGAYICSKSDMANSLLDEVAGIDE